MHKKPHGKANADPGVPAHKPGHGSLANEAKTVTPPAIVPPNPKLWDKLSFASCATTQDEVEFPRYLKDCGILDMIVHALARLEREKQRPPDAWEWLRYRFFLRTFNPGDKELFRKTINELMPKKEKLLKERNDLLRAKAKREEAANGVKQ